MVLASLAAVALAACGRGLTPVILKIDDPRPAAAKPDFGVVEVPYEAWMLVGELPRIDGKTVPGQFFVIDPSRGLSSLPLLEEPQRFTLYVPGCQVIEEDPGPVWRGMPPSGRAKMSWPPAAARETTRVVHDAWRGVNAPQGSPVVIDDLSGTVMRLKPAPGWKPSDEMTRAAQAQGAQDPWLLGAAGWHPSALCLVREGQTPGECEEHAVAVVWRRDGAQGGPEILWVRVPAALGGEVPRFAADWTVVDIR